MDIKINNPHVFISYAYGAKEYQDKVIEFVTSLMNNHMNFKLDKQSLKEGNDI